MNTRGKLIGTAAWDFALFSIRLLYVVPVAADSLSKQFGKRKPPRCLRGMPVGAQRSCNDNTFGESERERECVCGDAARWPGKGAMELEK